MIQSKSVCGVCCLFIIFLSSLPIYYSTQVMGMVHEEKISEDVSIFLPKNDESFPILVFDRVVGNYLGAEFSIMVTAVSDHPNITLWVWIDDHIVYNHTQFVFINHNIYVNASALGFLGQYMITVGMVDAWMLKRNITAFTTIDPIAPVISVSVDKEEIRFDEFLEVSWMVTDSNFQRVNILVEGKHVHTSYSPSTSIQISPDVWVLPEGYTQYNNTIRFEAFDSAGNKGEFEYNILYIDDRYGQFSEEDLRKRNVLITWNTVIAVIVFSIIIAIIMKNFNDRGKVRKDMARPRILGGASMRVQKYEGE